LFPIGLHSQNKTVVSSDSYITCFYPVSKVVSQDRWNQLVNQLNATEGIMKLKSIYKPEQERGQLILLIQSVSGVGENKKTFDLMQIKSMIIQWGMQPEEPEIKEGIHM
jgi:hypothetical protein